jgi:hypothetical protein
MCGLLLVSPRPASADWPADSLTDVPVCTADSVQSSPLIVADGRGGAIVGWRDGRAGGWEKAGLYAQHVLSSGDVDPTWPRDGSAICGGGCGWASEWKMVPDGAGGAIFAWSSAANRHLHAQHVLASGAIDPDWPAEGVAASTITVSLDYLGMVADGAGGAILAFVDTGNDKTLWDVYAQHVLARGAVDPAWPADGRALCVAPGRQYRPTVVADGAGGAIVAWQDQRRDGKLLSGKSFHDVSGNIFAQHVRSNGDVDAAWPANGRRLSEAGIRQRTPQSIADGAGGAIVTWVDSRAGDNHDDIYAQRVLAGGKVDPAWPKDGARLCDAAGSQEYPTIVADGGAPGACGAIVSWQDNRAAKYVAAGVNSYAINPGGIYAQHVLASGAVDPAWPDNGRALCSPARKDSWPCIVADGSGGAIVAWFTSPRLPPASDMAQSAAPCGAYRVGPIRVQRVLASGALDAAWPADGRTLCLAASEPYTQAVADGGGGLIVAFKACGVRAGDAGSQNPDRGNIYVKRVRGSGEPGGTEARTR